MRARLHRRRPRRAQPLEHRTLDRMAAAEAQAVVEVKYDQVTGNRFRHGTRVLRWRPDGKPAQCSCNQLQREALPAKLVTEVIGR